MSPGNLFILGSKGQRSRKRGTKTLPAWVVVLLWVLASSSPKVVCGAVMGKRDAVVNQQKVSLGVLPTTSTSSSAYKSNPKIAVQRRDADATTVAVAATAVQMRRKAENPSCELTSQQQRPPTSWRLIVLVVVLSICDKAGRQRALTRPSLAEAVAVGCSQSSDWPLTDPVDPGGRRRSALECGPTNYLWTAGGRDTTNGRTVHWRRSTPASVCVWTEWR